MRFYLVPGMDHCAGGEGAFAIDWLTALEQWVEEGESPEALLATRPAAAPGAPGAPQEPGRSFTRPACVYPQIARYDGSGDGTLATSFECVAP